MIRRDEQQDKDFRRIQALMHEISEWKRIVAMYQSAFAGLVDAGDLINWAGKHTEQMLDLERKLIASALKKFDQNYVQTAQFLGIPRSSLAEKIRRLGLENPERRLRIAPVRAAVITEKHRQAAELLAEKFVDLSPLADKSDPRWPGFVRVIRNAEIYSESSPTRQIPMPKIVDLARTIREEKEKISA